MNNIPLSLEAQFDLALLKLHLREHPEQAEEIALKQFQFHLEASASCQRFKAENQQLKAQLQSPSLPPFLTPSHRRLQTKYDRLRTEQIEVLQENVHLRQVKHNLVREIQQLRRENQQLRRENQNQRQRIRTLTPKSALLPDFLSRNLSDK